MTPSNSFSSLAEFAFAMDLGDGSRESHFYSQWDDTLPNRSDSPRPRLASSSEEEETEEDHKRAQELRDRSRANKQVAKLLQTVAYRRTVERPVAAPKPHPSETDGSQPLVTPPVRIPTMAGLRADESG